MKSEMITWDSLSHMHLDSGTIVVDLREPAEFARGHYPGAKNIPYDQLGRYIGELEKYRRFIFYCDHGSRSLMVAKRLSRRGMYTLSVMGGYEAR